MRQAGPCTGASGSPELVWAPGTWTGTSCWRRLPRGALGRRGRVAARRGRAPGVLRGSGAGGAGAGPGRARPPRRSRRSAREARVPGLRPQPASCRPGGQKRRRHRPSGLARGPRPPERRAGATRVQELEVIPGISDVRGQEEAQGEPCCPSGRRVDHGWVRGSQDLVVLKRSPKSPAEKPCCLYLTCDPDGGEEIVSVGILSSARNMEVYLGEEYCGTSRGRSVGTVLDSREHENIILYKKYLKLESSAHACKIKLLSFGEKQCVSVSHVVVHLEAVSANSSASAPALGSRVDLERVQTLVESMGSKLSPGAQQLMRMVRFQQQNCIPIGEQLRSVLGNAAYQRMVGLQPSATSGACDRSSPGPFPWRTALPSGGLTDGLKAGTEGRSRPPGDGHRTALGECDPLPQEQALPERAGEDAVTAFVPEPAGGSSGTPHADVLPLLQSLCGQVNRLRVGPGREWPGHGPQPSDGIVGVAMGEQPVCSYLEKILCKNMERMEKKLTDYIDQRIYKLQEHIDNKIALLMDLLQNPSSPPHGLPLRHYDSGETLSNGER